MCGEAIGQCARLARSASSGATARLARPSSTAVAAGMRSPVYRYSRVLMIGPSNGQNAAPPSPATSPTATCGSARYADSDISRMSHNSATLQPNPTAGPLTAAMIGSGKRSISSMICEPSRMLSSRATGSSRKVVIQFRSPPAQNARPAPVSTTTLASLSAASCRQTLASAQCRFSLTQLSSSARLTTTVRTGPVGFDGQLVGEIVFQVQHVAPIALARNRSIAFATATPSSNDGAICVPVRSASATWWKNATSAGSGVRACGSGNS